MRLVFSGLSAGLGVIGGRASVGAERGVAGSITGADAHEELAQSPRRWIGLEIRHIIFGSLMLMLLVPV